MQMFIKFMEIMNGLTNQVKIFTNAEKVNKLIKTDFIRKAMYSNWLTNMVLVKKANKK